MPQLHSPTAASWGSVYLRPIIGAHSHSANVVCPLPQFALRASRGDDLPVHGDGTSHRSFLFVEDVAEAFEVVLHKVSTPLVSDSLPQTSAVQVGLAWTTFLPDPLL